MVIYESLTILKPPYTVMNSIVKLDFSNFILFLFIAIYFLFLFSPPRIKTKLSTNLFIKI